MPYTFKGLGTEQNPYIISSLDDLIGLRDDCNTGNTFSGKYFKQTNDIDLESYLNTQINGWTPIGIDSTYYFGGNYDGNYNSIKNLWYSEQVNINFYGLFGYCYISSTLIHNIKNLIINISNKGCTLVNKSYCGALAGYMYSIQPSKLNIINCKVTGSFIKAYNIIGGLVGYAQTTVFRYCSSELNELIGIQQIGGLVGYGFVGTIFYNSYANVKLIKGIDSIGGLVGSLQGGGEIYNCYTNGNIEGTTAVGGLVGAFQQHTKNIENCYSASNVKGNNRTGSFIGILSNGSYFTNVRNCYSTGSVIGSGSTVAAFIGEVGTVVMTENIEFINCYTTNINIQPAITLQYSKVIGAIVKINDSNFYDGVMTGMSLGSEFAAIKNKTPYLINVPNNLPHEIEYTGLAEELVLPPGTYLFECYGAGSVAEDGYYATYTSNTLAGYSSGVITFNNQQILYLYAGGKGFLGYNINPLGGWNGGGAGTELSIVYNGEHPMSGGGATDIRLVSGNWDNFDSLKSRIMVAGGGGGISMNWSGAAYAPWIGGSGGGLTGGIPTANEDSQQIPLPSPIIAVGATQIAGGSGSSESNIFSRNGEFGKGGNGVYSRPIAIAYPTSAGGGGGYYGGGGGWYGASGGSSFISGHLGCDAIASSSTSSSIIHTGQPNHYSGLVFTDTKMMTGEHDGNGMIRITYLSGINNLPSFKQSSDKIKLKGIVTEMQNADVPLTQKIKMFKNGSIQINVLFESNNKDYIIVECIEHPQYSGKYIAFPADEDDCIDIYYKKENDQIYLYETATLKNSLYSSINLTLDFEFSNILQLTKNSELKTKEIIECYSYINI